MKLSVFKFVPIGFLAATLGFAGSASAQKNHDPLAAMGQKAYGVPVSNKIVEFEAKMQIGATEKSWTITVQEGTMAKILAFQGGFAYALVPILNHADFKSADFHVFRVTRDDAGNEAIKELEHPRGELGKVIQTSNDPKIQITLKSVSDLLLPAKSSVTKQDSPAGGPL